MENNENKWIIKTLDFMIIETLENSLGMLEETSGNHKIILSIGEGVINACTTFSHPQ